MLQLDTKKILNDLYLQLYKTLEQVAKHAVEYMVYELASTKSIDKNILEWEKDVIDALKFIGVEKANEIFIEFGLIKASELQTAKALSLNYGMGEFLQQNNPYIQEYLNSKYQYTTQDNLKANLRPTYFFENALIFIIPEINQAIENVIDNFDFSKYIVD